MRKLEELLKVNITNLSIAGLMLLGVSLGLGLGAMMAVGAGTEIGGHDAYHQRPGRRIGLLCWLAAAAVFFARRWALEAVGVSVDRKKASLRRRSMADWGLTRGIIGCSSFGLACALAFLTANSLQNGGPAESTGQKTAMDASTASQPTNTLAVPEMSRP